MQFRYVLLFAPFSFPPLGGTGAAMPALPVLGGLPVLPYTQRSPLPFVSGLFAFRRFLPFLIVFSLICDVNLPLFLLGSPLPGNFLRADSFLQHKIQRFHIGRLTCRPSLIYESAPVSFCGFLFFFSFTQLGSSFLSVSRSSRCGIPSPFLFNVFWTPLLLNTP